MSIKHVEEYRDPATARALLARIAEQAGGTLRLMEVCGTHTVAIFRSGIRSLLPETLTLLSGPGCPVCVTAQGEIDAFIKIARERDVIIATFGDLLRVPGSGSSLQAERAAGADIRVVYSTFDALALAEGNPDRRVVFLGVGFETTAPTVAAALVSARARGIGNFFVLSAHKTVPPALAALMESGSAAVDGFLLPGHVSVIIGTDAYRPFFEQYRVPCAVAGFEPTDILQAVRLLTAAAASGRPVLENAYGRAVTPEGNPKARSVMEGVFETVDADWRGLGTIPASGLAIREAYGDLDAARTFGVRIEAAPEPPGCACGEILTGARTPPECPLYRTRCTPLSPVGPCMVSTEGTCAAWHRFHEG